MEVKHSTQRRTSCKRGQLLVIFPFLMIFLVGMAAISLNVAQLSSERIYLQTATDACALSCARAQSVGLGMETQLNYVVMGLLVAIVVHLLMLDAGSIKQRIDDIADVNDYQEMIRDIIVPTMMHQIAFGTGLSNDILALCTYLPAFAADLTNSTTIQVWFPSDGLGPLGGIMAPFNAIIGNKYVMYATGSSLALLFPPTYLNKLGVDMMRSAEAFNLDKMNIPPFILRHGVGRGDTLYPEVATVFSTPDLGAAIKGDDRLGGARMFGLSSARPYWGFPGADPRAEEMDPLSFLSCMFILGPFWNERLVETGLMGFLDPVAVKVVMRGALEEIAGGLTSDSGASHSGSKGRQRGTGRASGGASFIGGFIDNTLMGESIAAGLL